jgi:hypothetical protein
MTPTFFRSFIFAVGLLLSNGVALAQPTELDRARARALMDDGDRRVVERDHQGALRAYREAHEIMGVPTTGIEVARTLAALGKLREARDVAVAVTRIPARPGEPRVFGEARRAADELARGLAARIPSLTLEIRGVQSVSEVRVLLDDAPLEPHAIGRPQELDPGQHTVVVSAPGYAEQRLRSSLSEGEQETLEVTLIAVRPRTDVLTVTAPPAPPLDSDGDTSPLVFIGFGAGAAGVLVGGVAGAMSLSRTSAARELCAGDDCPPSARDDIEAAETLATVSNVGFGVALVGIGVGVYGLLSSGGSEQPVGALRVRPMLGLRSAGVQGRF